MPDNEWANFMSTLSFGTALTRQPAAADEDIDLDDMVAALQQMDRQLQKLSGQLSDQASDSMDKFGTGIITPDDVLPLRKVKILLDCDSPNSVYYTFETRLVPDEYAGQFAVAFTYSLQKENKVELWAVHPDKHVIDYFVKKLDEEQRRIYRERRIANTGKIIYTSGIISVESVRW